LPLIVLQGIAAIGTSIDNNLGGCVMRNMNISVIVLSIFSLTPRVSAGECPTVQDLNGGMNDYVHALVEYNGQLIAAGEFSQAGGVNVNNIARWDGSNWISMGGPFFEVREMTVFNGLLIASTGGNLLGRWNGTSWQTQNTPNGMTNAFAVYNDDFIIGGQWFSAQNFVTVIKWNFDTGQWQALGAPGTFGTYSVKSLVVYNGQLIAGGDFFILNGQPANGLARWNESLQQWEKFEGLNNNGQVYAMTVHNGDLIVAGAFTHVNGIYSRGIARWNQKDGWQSMAGGVSQYVSSLAVYNGELIAGGYFTTAGTQSVNNIARWNDNVNDWQSVGEGVTNCCGYGAAVYALGVANGTLYAGGWFGFGEDGPQRIIGWQDCPPCTGDVTGDRAVNVGDLLAVINGWGPCAACSADVNGDQVVNVLDLLAVINAWGSCP
jgi:hypothetical protein